jgi:hypothetical protein
MFLSKIKSTRFFSLFPVYAVWLIFCAIVLTLTNASASLDKVAANNLRLPDVVLTYGFLLFWAILEALCVAIFLVLVEISLEKAFQKDFDRLFRPFFTIAVVGCLLIVLLAIFHII